MTVTHLGSLTLGGALPGAVTAAASGVAGINAALPDIQARIDALAAFAPSLVDFTAQLALATKMVESVTSAISLGLPAPSIAAQIAIVAALVADLEASVVAIGADLDVIVDFQADLGVGGLHVYHFAGNVEDCGDEIDAEINGGLPSGSGTDSANALLLITTTGATWTAMQSVFKVTP